MVGVGAAPDNRVIRVPPEPGLAEEHRVPRGFPTWRKARFFSLILSSSKSYFRVKPRETTSLFVYSMQPTTNFTENAQVFLFACSFVCSSLFSTDQTPSASRDAVYNFYIFFQALSCYYTFEFRNKYCGFLGSFTCANDIFILKITSRAIIKFGLPSLQYFLLHYWHVWPVYKLYYTISFKFSAHIRLQVRSRVR